MATEDSRAAPVLAACPRCGRSARRTVQGLCAACVAQQVSASLAEMPAEVTNEARTDDLLGLEVEGYVVHEPVGAGASGVVWRATRTATGEAAALKVLPRQLGDDPAWCIRFRREAAALAGLDHPGIVRVLDTGETCDGRLYLALEFVEGCDLRRLLRTGKLAAPRALHLARQAASALAHAHARGVVHRDIKPANLLVGPGDGLKVADFGLARTVNPPRPPGCGEPLLTGARDALGTPYYIAPEVVRDPTAASPASDVYGLGVILYEMLTGHLPLGHWAPPSQLAAVDRRIDALIAAALADRPTARVATMTDFLRELDAAQRALERRVRWRRWRGRSAFAAALAVAAGGGLLGLWSWRQEAGAAALWPDPAAATRARPWENSLGMRFVPVPGTRVLFSVWETRRGDFEAFFAENADLFFTLGAESDENGTPDAAPARATWVARPGMDWREPGFAQTPDHPVVCMSAVQASMFCSWLTARDVRSGRLRLGQHYRLPTDREWSMAAGLPPEPGATVPARHLALSPAPPSPPGNYAGAETAEDTFPGTAPVGSFAVGPHGLHDLAGNASEWCIDWRGPTDEPDVGGRLRGGFLRGAAWNHPEGERQRLDFREFARPMRRRVHQGFRVVLELDEAGRDAGGARAAGMVPGR